MSSNRKTLSNLRLALELACMDAALADQDGNKIEFLNERILTAAHELGKALITRRDNA